ncbi:hypothetical protein PSCLAVI8L_320077 [Pseudoclavibacter sp. 8L]|nr:hypothetical protein PSCLAVI8L_320077 [Pseudoclavibacter sp. 8L]
MLYAARHHSGIVHLALRLDRHEAIDLTFATVGLDVRPLVVVVMMSESEENVEGGFDLAVEAWDLPTEAQSEIVASRDD